AVFMWLHFTLLAQLFLSLGPRLTPLIRALLLPLTHPPIAAALWAAVGTCALLLWWLRSRTSKTEEARHVEILGF
ncbi:MAG TPA: hypothetical protein VEY91_05325, partial [Candidatus Limnocylindria bacterium]|nr:hypothetical protein [Candidatus Limnocylindria bacterium]